MKRDSNDQKGRRIQIRAVSVQIAETRMAICFRAGHGLGSTEVR